MMIMSLFQVTDALPYVQSANLLVNGHEIVLTETEQADLQSQVEKLFENSHTLPALGVVFDEEFKEDVKNGVFVSLKFDGVFEINDLPFEELFFRVNPDVYGFNLFRSNHGIVQGRCIYVDLDGKTMQEFSDYVNSFSAVQSELSAKQNSEIMSQNENEILQNGEKSAKNAQNLQNAGEQSGETTTEKPEILPPNFEHPSI